MSQGYLCLFLHAHLPFVRHPEEEYFLEENWLFEAITETYIPLIDMMDRLIAQGVPFQLTMSLTPTLTFMLKDPLLQNRYIKHLDKLIELASKEIERTEYETHYHGLALMYHERFKNARETFIKKYKKDLTLAFKKFQDLGYLEIVTSCATHAFLPNMSVNPKAMDAQIQIGVDYYRKVFGRKPRGFWLPECGYFPHVDELLQKAGIKYFFLDSHGILHADPSPRYSVYAPLYCPSGVAAFGRDWESSKQVWSSKEGYPGDPVYREYYRDIGFELDYEYIKPYIHPNGLRINTGLKYWRITGNTEYKEAYRPDWAKEKAAEHAGNFMFNRQKQIEHLSAHMDRKPIVVAPYDAELFGHWWFEGPMWIDFLIRKIAYDQKTVSLITPSQYLSQYSANQMAFPSQSSWGYKGYSEYWLEGSNDWIYRHLHTAERRMKELTDKFKTVFNNGVKRPLIKRALNQAARELVLAQASDWPFIMKTGTMVPYAMKRVKQHLSRFNQLYHDLMKKKVNQKWLNELEARDNIFYNINCASYYLERKTRQVTKQKAKRKPAMKRIKKEIQTKRKKSYGKKTKCSQIRK